MSDQTSQPQHKKLSIQVSLDGFSFYVKTIGEDAKGEKKSFPFKGTLNPEKCLLKIKHIIEEEEGLLNSGYEEVHVVYVNELYTLVPKELFDEEKCAEYLKYNTKILSTDYLAHDLIETLDLVCVYIPFTNINNYFFECFGSFDYLHIVTLELDKILGSAHKDDDAKVHIFLRGQDFDMIAHAGKQLKLCNTFAYLVPEDIAYHTLFCYEQLGFDLDKDRLFIHGSLGEDSAIYKLLYTYVRNMELKPDASLESQ